MPISHALLVAALALTVFSGSAALAQEAPRFDPRSLRGHVRGEPTRVLVLATPHLSALKTLDKAELEPLLKRLAAFAPSVIAVEALPGETLHTLAAYEADYTGVAAGFGGLHRRLGSLAEAEIGLSPPAAQAEARRRLARLPKSPPAADRRRLAAIFAAAHDPASALVQWLRLPPAERRAGAGVSADLAAALDRFAARRDETVLIAAELAVRLGLDRLHPADDQTDGDLALSRMDALERAWPRIQAALDNAELRRVREATAGAAKPGRLLDAYLALNTPALGEADVRGQWLPHLQLDLEDDLGRRRLIQWETRNLRMAAHLREATAEAPGGRILMIVGSAHKPWLDAYLSRMHDVKVVAADKVLGTTGP